MTAQPAPDVYALVHELTEALDDRMTKLGHPAILVVQESRGVCPPYECSARCRSYRALFVRATAWLAEHAPSEQRPARQLALLSGEG